MEAFTTVSVDLGDRSYPVEIGDGVRHRLALHIPSGCRRAAIVTQANIDVEVDAGCEQVVFTIGDGESHKVLETVETLCRDFATWGLTRNDVVVGVGGGIVTDVAGFAASVYHRGIPVIHVATSLLGQIDAAIGGKTGVNLPEGKNLVGSYWQPLAVLCDTETLSTLPARHLQAGLGELAKYHFLGGGRLDELSLADRVTSSVTIKATAVGADEREGGSRALLNYGHTLAHALEIAGDHALLHGEAVAIGLIYAAEVAQLMGRIDEDRVAEHRRVVGAYDLPLRPPADISFADVAPLFARDKKAVDSTTFILDGPTGPEVVTDVPMDILASAYERLCR
ncbi:MAG: 3-dehydroquinate synthase [Acidimicrobiales bacterium]|nr:3-dehydroquinate synthase [Acidimicrobiales bacterium]RZV48724.1 MAG: 3-dehydroquinate synthase [Acidimicrobiales bacterium]